MKIRFGKDIEIGTADMIGKSVFIDGEPYIIDGSMFYFDEAGGNGIKLHKTEENQTTIPQAKEVEWVNGDSAIYEGRGALVIAYHPHHPSVVIELPCNEYLNVLSSELSKPETQEDRDKREELEAAYDLYCEWVGDSVGKVAIDFTDWKSEPDYYRKWLRVVDKTGYRKGGE